MQIIELTKSDELFLLEALLSLAYDIAWGTPKDNARLIQIIEKIRNSVCESKS